MSTLVEEGMARGYVSAHIIMTEEGWGTQVGVFFSEKSNSLGCQNKQKIDGEECFKKGSWEVK